MTRQSSPSYDISASDVLVLGANGRIGTILRRQWPQGSARWHSRTPGDEFVSFDPLKEPAAIARAAEKACAILCLSGVTNLGAAQGGDLRDNARLARAAITAAATTGARVLLASTAAVYGAQSGLLREAGPVCPASDYGMSKLEMEQVALELAAELDCRVTSLRIGNVAGSDAILGGWRAGFALDRFADGRTPRRSYIGPVLLAEVLLRLCRCDALPKVLNVAAPGMVEMGALLDQAGLPWQSRTPSSDAIPEVQLDVSSLAKLVDFDADAGSPARLVAEWRQSEECGA